MTLVSRVFGLARDMVLAWLFGASPAAEAFFVAFRIPNLLRRLFAEGAFSQAFVPVFAEYRAHRDPYEVRRLLDHVSGSLGLVLLVVTVLGVLGAPWVIAVFAPGFVLGEDPTRYELAVTMLRVTFPYLMLISLTALCGSVLNTFGVFGIPAFTPVLLNATLIGFALGVSQYFREPVHALAWAVLLAGALQLLFQQPFLARLGMLPRPRPAWRDPGVRRILTLMLPALFGVGVGQINLLFDTLLASFLQSGSISWLYYSDRLVELPLALVGIAIGTVILPSLSSSHAGDEAEHFRDTLRWAMRLILLVGLPATVALLVLAEQLMAGIFHGGTFVHHDVLMAAASLRAYAVGLLGHLLVKVLAPAFFARQDTATPVRVGIVAMFVNMLLNLLLIFPFGHAGLALATSLSAFVNAGLLAWYLWRDGLLGRRLEWRAILADATRAIAATAAMVGILILLERPLAVWYDFSLVERFVHLGIMTVCGCAACAAVLWLGGVRLSDLRR